MFNLRGDAHKIYLHLRKTPHQIRETKYLKEIEEIRTFYQSIETDVLKLIHYRMIKEKNGSGMIPIFVTAIPWLLFLFSTHLENFLFQDGSMLWLFFSLIYLLFLVITVILHFRENAWAAFHIEIIQDIIKDRNEAGVTGG
ncbi:hypothetical protein NSA56_15265 [Oceanobacillus caeni]|uniref:Uncharacterized protein n=1 Tax=Oceanobacillus caeni TaxID=405946 RepID=A0ABR5MG18_9BACI|nr:hypothetical protein [Oceanobacillus caeni]KKE77946.1 hypothetical protein WH51_15180 [Bacilli bacterium VT-13-104]PZD84021.1 hypothetical protein DEJ64_13165 [Bacilli bacterium]KPH71340.1 hypothetical protein AFL42_15495 [Oceanobacillus caeni]MBU8792034.1 hypothetical protein [Oceanobacillus caeni]MCR1835705.1 hypothetical protein [Oceanobacillus caeni]